MKKETLKNNVKADSAFKLNLFYDDYPILHTHNFWEFMLITNGSYNHKINGKNIEINKNVLCLIRPADKHSIEKLSDNACHINFAVPDAIMHTQLDIIVHDGGYERIIKSGPIYFEISERALQNYLEIVSRINLLDSESIQWHYSMTRLFFNLIQDLIQHWGRQYAAPHEDIPKKVKEIIDAINFASESSKTLAEIMENSNYSYIHASRMFKNHMNMTLKKYHVKAKMKAASRLLEETPMSIVQVAEKLGYRSLSHFNIVFNKYFSISPSKYRSHWKEFYSGFEDV